jgi:menaquinone-dependent protoporphyrinogen oxidase
VVDVLPMPDVHHLAEYRAVIAGSAIRMDNWLPEALEFIQRHQHELAQKPFAAFLVCLALSVQGEKRQASAKIKAAGYLQPVRTLVPTISEGLFAGALDLSKLPLRYRLLFSVPVLMGLFKEGDYRDWDAIHQWADEVALKIG